MLRIQAYSCLLAVLTAAVLTGCSGDEPSPPVAAATPPSPPPAAPASPPAGEEDSDEGNDEGYGGEGYGSESYGSENSGGPGGGGRGRSLGSGPGGGRGRSLGAGPGDGGYGGYGDSYGEEEYMASGGGMGEGDDMGMYYGGYDPDEEARSMQGDMDEAYGGYPGMGGEEGYGDEIVGPGGPGMGGPGMGGYGGYPGAGGMGGANNRAAGALAFVRQTCVNCHGVRQQRGDVRLDRLSANFEDPGNVQLWQQVAEQLEAGTMPPESVRQQPDPVQKQMVLEFVLSALESSGVANQNLLEQAQFAFSAGKEKKALDLMYAYALTASESAANEVFDKVQFFAPEEALDEDRKLRRLATTLRFAVGVNLDAPSTLTDLEPIGTGEGSRGGGYGGGSYGGEASFGSGSMGRGGGRQQGNNSAGRSFSSLTGDLGSALVAAFETRWTEGQLGTVFNEVVAAAPTTGGPGMGGPGMGGGPGLGGMGGPGMGGGYGSGGYGSGGYGGEANFGAGGDGYAGYGDDDDEGYGGGYGGESATGPTTGKSLDVKPGNSVTAGLFFVGTGSQSELLERAAKQGVDALFIYDVKATPNRRMGSVLNETRIRLVLVNGKAVSATQTLKNRDVERARMRGTEDDVDKNIDRLFTHFDTIFNLTPMPNMQPESARGRIRQLLADREALPEDEEASRNLAIMFETRLFHSKGLLTQDEMSMIYQIVMEGNEGESLAFGSEEDRMLVYDEVLANFN